MSDERGAKATTDLSITHCCNRWVVFGRQDAGGTLKSLSDFSSDFVACCPTALGVVAASAGCWSPVFTGAE